MKTLNKFHQNCIERKLTAEHFIQSTLTSTSLLHLPAWFHRRLNLILSNWKWECARSWWTEIKHFRVAAAGMGATFMPKTQQLSLKNSEIQLILIISLVLFSFLAFSGFTAIFLFHNFHSTLFALFFEKLLFQRPRMKVRQRNWSDGCLGDDISKEGSGRNLKASYRVFV